VVGIEPTSYPSIAALRIVETIHTPLEEKSERIVLPPFPALLESR